MQSDFLSFFLIKISIRLYKLIKLISSLLNLLIKLNLLRNRLIFVVYINPLFKFSNNK